MALETEVAALTTAVNSVVSAVQADTSKRASSVTAAQAAAVAAQDAVINASDTAAAAAAATLATAVSGYIGTATAAAASASLSADAAATDGEAFTTLAAGEAATPNGGRFKVFAASDDASIEFRQRNATGSGSVVLKTMPSSAKVTTIGNLVGPSIISFGAGKAIIHDYNGIHGLPRVLYVPRDVSIQTVGGGAANFTGVGTDSTRLPGYYEIVLANSPNLFKVYLNRATGEITVVPRATLPALTDGLLPLFEVVAATISNARVPVEKTEAGNGTVHFYDPEVEEAGHLLLIPRYRWSNGLYTVDRPVPVSQWGRPVMFDAEITLATGGTPQTLCINGPAAAQGGNPLLVATHPRQPSGATSIRIASGTQAASPLAHHTGHPVLGVTQGGSVRNIANLGQNNPELGTLKLGNVAYANFTDPALIAAGYTKAVTSSSKTSAFYGVPIDDIRPGDTRFVRLAVELDYDTTADIDIPFFISAYVDGGTLGRHTSAFRIERQLSARAVILVAQHTLPANTTFTGWQGMWVGCSAFGGKDIKFGGLQIGQSSRRATWVLRGDFPVPVTAAVTPEAPVYDLATISKLAGKATGRRIVYPKRMYLVEGQRQTIYGDGLLDVRSNMQDATFAWEPNKILFSNANDKLIPQEFKKSTVIVGGQMPSKINLKVRTEVGDDSARQGVMPVEVLQASTASVSGKSIRLLTTGDSVTEYAGWPLAARRELLRLGITPSYIGTVPMEESDNLTSVTIPGEARASRTSTNFSYEADPSNSVTCQPFDDSYIATYLSLPKAGLESDNVKRKWNPFLRPTVAGDPSANIRQGHILDFANYLKRFNDYYTGIGQPQNVMLQPDVNTMVIGSNDYLKYTTAQWLTRFEFVKNAHRDWAARSLAAWPNTKVVFMVNPLGRNIQGDDDYPKAQQLAYLIATVVDEFKNVKDANGNPMVLWVSALPHCSTMIGHKYLAAPFSVDAITGFIDTGLRDATHSEGLTKEQAGILMSGVYACIAAGIA